jgi:hypothetical protein
MALDDQDEVIGYEFVNLGKMMESVQKGVDPGEAIKRCTGTTGRFADAARTINPRHE